MTEEFAISIPDECSKIYYENYKNMDERLRKKFSCEMLKECFDQMVIPAIDKTRQLDREAI